MRKLASIQKIENISPIIGADNIELATILGWKVIIRKDDNYKINDICVYIEIDSILPEKPEFEFLKEKKYKIKTWKLNKFNVISQGIIFPLTILPKSKYKIGDDVTKVLGIKKYDPEDEKEKKLIQNKQLKNKMVKYFYRYEWFRKLIKIARKSGKWPSFIPKTDEIRLQSFPGLLKNEDIFYTSEKCDGQSGTFAIKWKKRFGIFKFPEFYVCARKIRLLWPDKSNYWKIFKKLNLEKKLKWLKRDIAIQGEIIGPGVQKNKYKLKELEFRIFLVYDIKKKKYLPYDQLLEITKKKLGLMTVPIISNHFILKKSVDKMVEYSKGSSLLTEPEVYIPREGIVFRSITNSHFSFKVINPDFLLKFSL